MLILCGLPLEPNRRKPSVFAIARYVFQKVLHYYVWNKVANRFGLPSIHTLKCDACSSFQSVPIACTVIVAGELA